MMERTLVFQRLVQRDMSEILRYYHDEAGEVVADRFYQTFLQVVDRALENPEHFHPVSDLLRRAPVPGFPYHFLYRKISNGIRILVLRHDQRRPSFGLGRK
jgi:plasmid stabilization system protein ParE